MLVLTTILQFFRSQHRRHYQRFLGKLELIHVCLSTCFKDNGSLGIVLALAAYTFLKV